MECTLKFLQTQGQLSFTPLQVRWQNLRDTHLCLGSRQGVSESSGPYTQKRDSSSPPPSLHFWRDKEMFPGELITRIHFFPWETTLPKGASLTQSTLSAMLCFVSFLIFFRNWRTSRILYYTWEPNSYEWHYFEEVDAPRTPSKTSEHSQGCSGGTAIGRSPCMQLT